MVLLDFAIAMTTPRDVLDAILYRQQDAASIYEAYIAETSTIGRLSVRAETALMEVCTNLEEKKNLIIYIRGFDYGKSA